LTEETKPAPTKFRGVITNTSNSFPIYTPQQLQLPKKDGLARGNRKCATLNLESNTLGDQRDLIHNPEPNRNPNRAGIGKNRPERGQEATKISKA
jgi:hypothetical protein